jgi:hypothetical protein
MGLGVRDFFAEMLLLYLVFQQKCVVIAKDLRCVQHHRSLQKKTGTGRSEPPNTDNPTTAF